MNGLPYEKVKGLTPVNGKTSHLKNYNEEGDMLAMKQNSRNNNTRMPTLPQSIKGSIGSQGHPQLAQSQKRGQPQIGMHMNIAANDITFANSYN